MIFFWEIWYLKLPLFKNYFPLSLWLTKLCNLSHCKWISIAFPDSTLHQMFSSSWKKATLFVMYFMYFILEAINYLLLINISGWLRYQNFAIKKNYGDSLRASTEKRLGCPKKEAMKRYSWYVWIHFWEITAKIEAPPGSASTLERKYNFLKDCLHLRKSTIIFSKKRLLVLDPKKSKGANRNAAILMLVG